MSIECIAFREYRKNTLLGFASFQFGSGLVIHECCIHEKGGKHWVSFPAREYQPKDGSEKKWMPLVEIPDRDRKDRFQAAAIQAWQQREQCHE